MADKPIGAGKSSFDLIDSTLVFDELRLSKDMTFLDLACGTGKYTIMASEIIGDEGRIYATDLWEEGISALLDQISAKKIKNVKASVGDVSIRIPIEDDCIDICLMATVLHDLMQIKADDGALREIMRVIKPQGTLAIIEFKKIEGPPGPPIEIRLSPQELEKVVTPYGFRKERVVDIGPYNYLTVFTAIRLT